jgi:hypothetical protein
MVRETATEISHAVVLVERREASHTSYFIVNMLRSDTYILSSVRHREGFTKSVYMRIDAY